MTLTKVQPGSLIVIAVENLSSVLPTVTGSTTEKTPPKVLPNTDASNVNIASRTQLYYIRAALGGNCTIAFSASSCGMHEFGGPGVPCSLSSSVTGNGTSPTGLATMLAAGRPLADPMSQALLVIGFCGIASGTITAPSGWVPGSVQSWSATVPMMLAANLLFAPAGGIALANFTFSAGEFMASQAMFRGAPIDRQPVFGPWPGPEPFPGA